MWRFVPANMRAWLVAGRLPAPAAHPPLWVSVVSDVVGNSPPHPLVIALTRSTKKRTLSKKPNLAQLYTKSRSEVPKYRRFFDIIYQTKYRLEIIDI